MFRIMYGNRWFEPKGITKGNKGFKIVGNTQELPEFIKRGSSPTFYDAKGIWSVINNIIDGYYKMNNLTNKERLFITSLFDYIFKDII